MTQLAANVNASAELWTVDSLPSTRYVQVGDEIVEVRSSFPSQTFSLTGEPTDPKIRVRRAQSGTTAASHSGGATLEPVYGAGGAGGGHITVDNTVDAPAEVATLIAPGAVLTEGQADLSALEGVQTVRLLGPYRVNFNDAGAEPNGDGVLVGPELVLGTVGISVFPTIITTWDNLGSNPQIRIDLYGPHGWGADTPGALGENMWRSDPTQLQYGPSGGAAGYGVAAASGPTEVVGPWVEGPRSFVTRDPAMRIVVTLNGSAPGTPTQGAADIYALIAEPAA